MSSSALGSSHPAVRRLLRGLLFSMLVLAAPLVADSFARIVRLSYVDGNVELDKGDGRGFNPAYMNMPISRGWKLWARDGQAEVEFEDGSSIRLTPQTLIAFANLSLDSRGGRDTSVELEQGTAYFDIRHREQDSFHLLAGHDRIELPKSAHFRVDTEAHQVELAVLGGEVQVSNGSGAEVSVRKGESIRLDNDDPNRYYLAKTVDPENYDRWDSERTKNHDEAVSRAAVSAVDNRVMYGLSDLNAYGRYFFVPGYGYMWRPASASLAWDPFADGYWVSYPGSGYVFVSSYPWGWAPYRYGSWYFVAGYGWCWAPGQNWNSWHAVPPVQNLPPNFHQPEAPHRGPPVIAIDHDTPLLVPPRRVLDNDDLEHDWPRAIREAEATDQLLRQGQSQATVPPAGFRSGTTRTPDPAAGITVVGPVGRATPTSEGLERASNLLNERRERDQRNMDLDRARQMAPQTTPAGSSVFGPARNSVPAVPQTLLAPISPTSRPDIHTSAPAMSPRMESHDAIRFPSMHSESRAMGPPPSMGPSRSASPSFSPPAISRAPSAGNGGGGGRSAGSHR